MERSACAEIHRIIYEKMISFTLSVIVLLVGYLLYGRITEKIFCPDARPTPSKAMQDNVDFVPMKTWRVFLIQLLNIAGTGPIFGALMGAVFGPVVFVWIVLGSILGGAVHDYMTGMISVRHNGESIAALSGIYLGNATKWVMRVFSVILLTLVGTVFITSPATLLAKLTPDVLNTKFWIFVILAYYILATLLPIDKLIGKLYPIFGVILLLMAAGIIGGLILHDEYTIPELTLSNLHPDGLPAWPFMCITVACGAISGFHATQSPMMAKCIMHERNGHTVFYGAMICESCIALIWAAAGVAFYSTTDALSASINHLGQSSVVYDISTGLLGKVGGILAIIGVIVCPVTSGDTAFRSTRLILAEWTGLKQQSLKNRLLLTIPLLTVGAVLSQLDFNVLWRYFSWSNQTLAMIALWVATAYLSQNCKYRFGFWITALPATFMSAVCMTYILMADEGLGLSCSIAYPAGIVFAMLCLAGCLWRIKRGKYANHTKA